MDCQAGTRKQTSGYPGDIIQGGARRSKKGDGWSANIQILDG